MHQIHLTESNRLESLTQAFKALAFQKGKNPFTKRIVLVPSAAFKSHLKLDLTRDENIGISFGMHLVSYEEGLVFLSELFLEEKQQKKVPKLLDLTLLLQSMMLKLLSCHDDVENAKAKEPLHGYLGKKNTAPLKQGEEKKLYFLAKSLARLFLNYSRFAKPGALAFSREEGSNFELHLFNQLFTSNSPWTTRIDKLSNPLKSFGCPEEMEIFVFAPFMTLGEVEFLKKISSKVPVEVFTLTPTSVLFDDVISDHEEARLKKKQSNRENFSSLKKNALLANYSLLFRETQKNILDSADTSLGLYLVEAAAAEEKAWNDLIQPEHLLIGRSEKLTLLKGLQTDLILMRLPEDPLPIEEKSCSIQIHEAPSMLREIEILYQELLRMMDQKKQTGDLLEPCDIQVFAKDIKRYEPFIKAIFGSKSSILKFQLIGERASPQPLVSAFIQLMELAFGKFESIAIVSLLENSSFRKKWGLTKSDLQTIRGLMEEGSFQWGLNLKHKSQYFESKGFLKCNYDNSAGTKEDFERDILQRLVGVESDEGGRKIEIKDAEVVASWLSILNCLQEELAFFSSDLRKTIGEWSLQLETLLEKHFSPNGDSEEEAAFFFIQSKIREIGTLGRETDSTPCLFSTIYLYLKDALDGSAANDREEDLNSVRFSSLLPHHAMPGKVIAMIGLEEKVFPGRDPQDSLDLLKNAKGSFFIPKVSDIDRFLFMEALLSVRDTLYLSYPGRDKSGEECAPSSAILDLTHYLDCAFTLNGSKPSSLIVFKHPERRYDPYYFNETSPVKSISPAHFKEYAASLQEKKIRSVSPKEKNTPNTVKESVSLKELSSFLRNPLAAYLKAKGLNIPRHSEKLAGHPLDIPKKLKRVVRKKTLIDDDPALAALESYSWQTPPLFQEHYRTKLNSEKESALEELGKIGVQPKDIRTVNLLPYKDVEPIHEDNILHMPGFMIRDYTLIHGSIEQLTPIGIVRIHQNFESEALSSLPALAASQIAFSKETRAPNRLFVLGKKKGVVTLEDPEDYLARLIDIYTEGTEKPLLLFPSFLKPLAEKNAEELQKAIEKAFDPFQENEVSELLEWVYGSKEAIDAKGLIDELSEKARLIYAPLLQVESLKKEGSN